MKWTTNAEEFDARGYARRLMKRIASTKTDDSLSVKRRTYTKNDPLAFALVYLRHHLKDDATGGAITFSDAHLEWVTRAKEWIVPPTEPEESRHAEVAPRSTGKSTWWFLILPLWAAAHGHLKFVAAFADSAAQAELHLASFKRELETNALLRADFPELVAPATRGRGALVSDNSSMFQAASGFAFMAKGIDSGALGTKVGAQRPDLILLDDVEPGESSYSLAQMKKRLSTITDVILPLSFMARVVLVGTVTMPGSIVHQLVRRANGLPVEEGEEWIENEHFTPHHYHPIITRDDGTERSVWPGKWPMEYLDERRHTRSFAKNFANDPMGADGDYWTPDSFIIGAVEGVTHTLLSIDPAVTTKASSDFTGLGVVGYSPMERKCYVSMATAVKLGPAFLRERVLKILEKYPDIGLILIETNQGGDTWKSILHDMPVRVVTVHQTVKKEVRAATVLNHYDRGRVLHAHDLTALETQMVAFPGAPNDDLVDAVGSGIAYFLNRKRKRRAGSVSESYV